VKILRWIIAFPIAWALSAAVWFILESLTPNTLVGQIAIYTPIAIRALLPTLVLVFSAVWICPARGRKAPFAFFTLALLLSAGGIELLRAYQLEISGFWIAGFLGVVSGAIIGLLLSLRFLSLKKGISNEPAT